MRLQHWLVSKIRGLTSLLTLYYNTYPSITGRPDLCSYYRKYNKSSPYVFLLLTVTLFVAQLIRFATAIPNHEPWSMWSRLLRGMAINDTIISICAYSCMQIRRSACLPEHKYDFKYQAATRRKLLLLWLVPAVILTLPPLVLPADSGGREIAFIIWVLFCILLLQICLLAVDGIWNRIALIALFNTGFCATATIRGFFVEYNFPKFVSPVLLSVSFFISYERQRRENFLLRRTLKKQKMMYEKHLERVQDPVMILDRQELLFENEAAREKIARSHPELLERARDIIADDGTSLRDHILSRLEKVSPDPETEATQRKYYMHSKGNDLLSCDRVLSVTLIESSSLERGKVVSLAFHDLTEELAAEQERVEAKYKNMLLFSLSHELRTPLNIFQAFLAASKSLVRNPEQAEMRQNAKGAWRYLRNKISDILDYVQLLNGDFVVHRSRFSLQEFVRMLFRVTRSMLADRRSTIRLDFAVSQSVHNDFFCDRDRLEQVLFNLLSNAVKYTTAGTISLRVRMGTEVTDGELASSVVFSVSDTGCGMSAECVRSLFSLQSHRDGSLDPHTRVDYRHKSTGLSGLGLTVSRMICERFGSVIRVRSSPGRGATFSFAVSAEPSRAPSRSGDSAIQDSTEATDVAEEGEGSQVCKWMHIDAGIPAEEQLATRRELRAIGAAVMVVDDNVLNRCVVRGMVKKMGFEVTEAENGKEAVEKLARIQEMAQREGQVVVLMDLDMPVMDGIEATVEIRRRGNTRDRPHIVALTAFASEVERAKCAEVGMDGFISKPLTKENLVDLFRGLGLI